MWHPSTCITRKEPWRMYEATLALQFKKIIILTCVLTLTEFKGAITSYQSHIHAIL